MAIATATETNGDPVTIRGDSKPSVSWALRGAVEPTTSYVASSHMTCGNVASASLVVTCASVDYTSIQTVVQGSYDAATWFDIPSSHSATNCDAHSQTLANLSAAATVNYLIEFPITSGRIRYLRCQVKRTGGTATGTVAITGHLGGRR